MANIDLALINSSGRGRPVPKEMDRHMVKFIVRRRKDAIEVDPSLLQTERWDHSDVFYAARTWLNQHGWDTSVYNDNIAGGATRRKDFYDMIKDVCENFYRVKRHQIGIFPEDRAIMAYGGMMYAASFANLRMLMGTGTDVIVVEKQGTVVKMMPFTVNTGVAFIQSQGFVSEYGVALARLANRDREACFEYTDKYLPKFKGNVGTLTDCDSSGVVIGMKINGATRLGTDLDTIKEINEVNDKEWELDIVLPIELEDLEESNSVNSHWYGLQGIVLGTGKLYRELSWDERLLYRKYLTARPEILQDRSDSGTGTVLEYLQEHRIELNTVLAAIKPQAFWNWLKWKMLQVWPDRDYRRGGLDLERETFRTPTLNRFIEYYDVKTKSVSKVSINEIQVEISNVRGLYDDIEGFRDSVPIVKKAIKGDIMSNVILQDKDIQKMDLALEKIMKNGNGNDSNDTTTATKKKSKKEMQTAADEDSEEYDEDYDGDEWDSDGDYNGENDV
jgi:hypothetical protein